MTAIVIDANLALALVVPLPYSNTVQQLVEKWHQQAVRFAVPALWGIRGRLRLAQGDYCWRAHGRGSVRSR